MEEKEKQQSVDELRQAIQAERQQRADRALQRINAILLEERCGLVATAILRGKDSETRVDVVAFD